MQKPKITDEMLRQAAHEVNEAMLASLPKPEECQHEFSPDFNRKMHEICPSIDPDTGKVHSTEEPKEE